MKNIRLLDCTLRDGGCVNNFNFGSLYMNQILKGVEESGVEIIELGYIDKQAGSEQGRTQFCNEGVISQHFLKSKKKGTTYVAMVDFGKYDPDFLQPKEESGIDGIRLAFHKKNRKDILEWGRKILDKGYQLFVQPMTCLRYSDFELLDLIQDVNTILPDATAFYIVDSFGEMRLKDLNRIANLVDHNLAPNIAMGLHSHNNLQLSYSNAVTLLNFRTERDMIFDSSIMGMGKGAGNMTTELFAEHLNIYNGKKYNISSLLEVVDSTINQIRENYTWGYAIEYYLSAINQCTPSYAGHFYKKHTLSIAQVAELLGMVREEKKISFDKNYAEELYYQYNQKNYDDTNTLEELKKKLDGKKVLIVAPGRTVKENLETIREVSKQDDIVTVALNHIPIVKADFILATKEAAYNIVKESKTPIIVTSNIVVDEELIINYETWTTWGDEKHDNALSILLNLLKTINVRDLLLAGCDGFSSDMDENYFEEALKRPVTKEQAEDRNDSISKILTDLQASMNIVFVTPSKYSK